MGPHLVGPFLERFLDGELLRLLEEAIEAACAAKSPYLEAKARRSLAHAAVLLGHWERAQQEIERAVSLAEHHGWTRLHSVRVWLCIRRGQLREARVALARSRDFLQRLLADEGHERLYLDLLEAWLDTEEGAPDDLARAAARLERCAGHPGLGQSPRYRHIHLLRRACLLEAQQDPEAALAAVDEALGVYRESGALIEDTLLEQHVVLARLSAAAGRVPQARQAAEEGLGLAAEVADSLDEAWRRTFVTEAPEVAALLRHAAELGLEPPGALLAVRPSGGE